VKAEIADKEIRAERFRAALGQNQAPGAGQAARPPAAPPGAEARAREALAFNRFLLASKPGAGKTEKPGASANKPGAEKGEASGKSEGGAKLEEGSEEMAAMGSASGAQASGVGGRKGRSSGEGGGGSGSDEPGVAGAAAASGPGKTARAQTPGEEAITEVAAAISAAAQAPTPQAWNRPEGPTQQAQRPRELPQPLPGVDPVHQLLIGKGPGGTEAKMIISVGPLAGTTINLREGPGGLEAQILTQTASSRQTLSSAMQAVAARLKEKGYKLEVRFDGGGTPQRPDQERPRR
jgi:hypothetical protein